MRGKVTEKTPELEQKIIQLYVSGITQQKISTIVHVGTKYVTKVLRDANIERYSYGKKGNKKLLADSYLQTHSLTKTAKLFNTSAERVKKALVELDIPLFKQSKHKINENIFDVIDTEEKAYWLGFIYADGYVSALTKSHNKYTLGITLKISDEQHLRKFNDFISGDAFIIRFGTTKLNGKIYKNTQWSVSNKHLWEILNKKGVVPNKSLILKFPTEDIVPKHLISHFIRGYFDGDGCIMTKDTSVKSLATSIIGTAHMMNAIEAWVGSTGHVKPYTPKDNTVYYLIYKVAWSIKFLEKIYNGATIYLNRKYDLWQNFCRSNMKMLEELRDKFGENWDVNSEVTHYLNYNTYRNA